MSCINIKYLAAKVPALLLLLSACALSSPVKNFGSGEFAIWNKVITKELFQSLVGPGDFSTTFNDTKLVYIFVYQPPASDPDYVLSVAIEVRLGGTLINRSEYESKVTTTPLSERTRIFPSIGARAQTTAPFFGPGGSSFGLLSTTNDEHYDINVNVLNSGAEGNVATFDVLEISSILHKSYDSLIAVTDK